MPNGVASRIGVGGLRPFQFPRFPWGPQWPGLPTPTGGGFFPQRTAQPLTGAPGGLAGAPVAGGLAGAANVPPWLGQWMARHPGFGALGGMRPQDAINAPRALAVQMLGWGQNAGLFDPLGSQSIMEMLRRQAVEDMAARQNAARLGVQARGGDQYLQGYGSLMSQLMGQSDLSRLLGGAQLQLAMGSQDFYRRLLAQMLGASYEDILAAEQTERTRAAQPLGGALSPLAYLGGAGIGALGGGDREERT